MSFIEKHIPLGHGITANISTEGEKCCVHFAVETALDKFHWKDFLLIFGMEQHSDFLHLLTQFHATTISRYSIGYGDAYCLAECQVENFLQAVSQIVADYFQPISATIRRKSS